MPNEPIKGRGAHRNPHNRFERLRVEDDFEQIVAEARAKPRAEYLRDSAASVVSENHSPDVPFRYSVNPYRGCEHGCAYCYARPTHEYLGFSAGLDFETKILAKPEAAELLRKWLSRPTWQPEPITMSGVTDCYQPVERRLEITRRCLQVFLDFRQPVGIITKNALVLRDLDLLEALAELNLVHVWVSVTTLSADLAGRLEPRTSRPAARLQAIGRLREAGIPVGAMIAPLIPGLNSVEVPQLLEAVREAGAQSAGYVLVRLPGAVETIFAEWLAREMPDKKPGVEAQIRATREGQLSDSRFGSRMRGAGPLADQLREMFQVFASRCELNRALPELDGAHFRVPGRARQGRLF